MQRRGFLASAAAAPAMFGGAPGAGMVEREATRPTVHCERSVDVFGQPETRVWVQRDYGDVTFAADMLSISGNHGARAADVAAVVARYVARSVAQLSDDRDLDEKLARIRADPSLRGPA